MGICQGPYGGPTGGGGCFLCEEEVWQVLLQQRLVHVSAIQRCFFFFLTTIKPGVDSLTTIKPRVELSLSLQGAALLTPSRPSSPSVGSAGRRGQLGTPALALHTYRLRLWVLAGGGFLAGARAGIITSPVFLNTPNPVDVVVRGGHRVQVQDASPDLGAGAIGLDLYCKVQQPFDDTFFG